MPLDIASLRGARGAELFMLVWSEKRRMPAVNVSSCDSWAGRRLAGGAQFTLTSRARRPSLKVIVTDLGTGFYRADLLARVPGSFLRRRGLRLHGAARARRGECEAARGRRGACRCAFHNLVPGAVSMTALASTPTPTAATVA
jgi:hypothetical protein